MFLYPVAGALVYDGVTAFDPDTGAFTIYVDSLGKVAGGVALHIGTWVSSRLVKRIGWLT
jgi:hypothetical protein